MAFHALIAVRTAIFPVMHEGNRGAVELIEIFKAQRRSAGILDPNPRVLALSDTPIRAQDCEDYEFLQVYANICEFIVGSEYSGFAGLVTATTKSVLLHASASKIWEANASEFNLNKATGAAAQVRENLKRLEAHTQSGGALVRFMINAVLEAIRATYLCYNVKALDMSKVVMCGSDVFGRPLEPSEIASLYQTRETKLIKMRDREKLEASYVITTKYDELISAR